MLYHGTRQGFRSGGYLFPRSWHGQPGTTAPTNEGQESPADSGDWVYVTTDLNVAWVYAWCAVGRGKPKVLIVEPTDEVVADPEHSHAMQAYRTRSARVVKVLTEPTMTERQAREGWVTV